ncbi:lipase member H-like isoform X2 [Melanaphis sacchari]|uniref:lipase member H-like isoform X2 n=1 Tax=Melanaphis sacchari TaxID=742174 RepID=UPI000DC1392A|nr:lipase member H-like isoform X2 [Melanaphis sacchari]
MKFDFRGINILTYFICLSFIPVSLCLMQNVLNLNYWQCVMKRTDQCPDMDIKIFLYSSGAKRKKLIDVRNKNSLRYSGWDPSKKNVIIIHGFNGTESKTPMTIIRNAYLNRKDYNVFTVDWEPLTFFPCYLSSLSNTRLVAQCTAQFYAHLTYSGASAYDIHCVGHSLGAHICGMISNHLTHRQHKIIGLDPARPLVDRYGSAEFRLTRDDATVVQVIHTNAGFLGETPQVGHVDFCVNGGRLQPSCAKEPRTIRNNYCSSPVWRNNPLAQLKCRLRIPVGRRSIVVTDGVYKQIFLKGFFIFCFFWAILLQRFWSRKRFL